MIYVKDVAMRSNEDDIQGVAEWYIKDLAQKNMWPKELQKLIIR